MTLPALSTKWISPITASLLLVPFWLMLDGGDYEETDSAMSA
jgi:hypothetical protein